MKCQHLYLALGITVFTLLGSNSALAGYMTCVKLSNTNYAPGGQFNSRYMTFSGCSINTAGQLQCSSASGTTTINCVGGRGAWILTGQEEDHYTCMPPFSD